MAGFLSLMAILFWKIIHQAMTVITEIQNQAGIVDQKTIDLAVNQGKTAVGSTIPILLFIAWLAISLDTYLIGKKLDKASPDNN